MFENLGNIFQGSPSTTVDRLETCDILQTLKWKFAAIIPYFVTGQTCLEPRAARKDVAS